MNLENPACKKIAPRQKTTRTGFPIAKDVKPRKLRDSFPPVFPAFRSSKSWSTIVLDLRPDFIGPRNRRDISVNFITDFHLESS